MAPIIISIEAHAGKTIDESAYDLHSRPMLKEGTQVKLNPTVLEDQSLKTNHHLLKRIIEEERAGEVVNLDHARSTGELFRYWVKFYYGKILLPEQFIIIQ